MVVVAIVLIATMVVMLILVPFKLWFRALVSSAHVSMAKLIGMKMRKVDCQLITLNYITVRKAGLKMTIDELETHYLTGGNVERVVKALVASYSANIDLSVQKAKAIDLAGRDIYEAVKNTVIPKIIETPEISAVAKDGIELIVKAKVTVISNMLMQISGAGEDTIIARVGEGIVTTVGSTDSHKMILESPELISSTVLEKGLDRGTAFYIQSLDIADIDVGRNIDAELNIAKAEAEKRIAQSKAEERKSMAIAAENEMKARVQEMRAEVIRAEAEVPKALAKALTSGNISVNDYYEMQNVQADTAMRKSLSRVEEEKVERLTSPSRRENAAQARAQAQMPPFGGSSSYGGTPPYAPQQPFNNPVTQSYNNSSNQSYSPPLSPLAARFASLAASQNQKKGTTDDTKK
ncbi:MAG: flotillin-like protein FloA [Clostridia bacterium]|nr:flotillin-like protein FloA [Clostridia bacterium]